jgi:hypothetical protein
MANSDVNGADARYQAGLGRIRAGMGELRSLYRELEERDSQASLRATLLKILHDVDELMLRETTPPPAIEPEPAEGAPAGISPTLEEASQATEPESGG